MLNFERTFDQGRHLFTHPIGSTASESEKACRTSIASLAEEAKAGNDDAIEMLINFSAGANHSEIRQLAEQSLIDLYTDPTVSDHTKSQIEEQALAFHELTEKANAAPKENSGFVPHEISAQILYLAGQRAHSLNQRNTEDMINARLRGQVYRHGNAPEEDKDLLSRGRLVFGHELINGSKQLRHLRPHETCLDLANQAGFKKAIGEIKSHLKQGAPATIFVNTGGHWVPLILQRNRGDKINCHVVDSNHQDGSKLSEQIESGLKEALDDQMGKFYFKDASMQTCTPNACGPLAMRLLFVLDSMSGIDSPDFDMPAAIETSINAWNELDEKQQNATVTGIRAELLGATVRAVNADD
ncbi:hypothetical protein [Noviherbaspirillum sp.]|uniref:hypothetical protein n=1 Tax=Noviherbaspirillum sp. TaxID=1926288 RepID=UPI002B491E76|nr:hypothetical protein [Noviherbaspirillum sp.]HJV80566.1 hypothetical protein [Noviherbaspirillum sp.]